MTDAALGVAGPLAAAACFAVLGRVRPGWLVPALLALVPLQVRVFAHVEIATCALLGAVAARAPDMARTAAREPLATAALVAFPLWIAASALWARQPAFVPGLFLKWSAVAAAALLAAADDEPRVAPLAVGALAAVVPASLWALGERLHLVAPRGDPRALEAQLIRVGDLVRGRALFHHPNKLAEFLEQVGLLLGGTALGGGVTPAVRAVGAAGFAVALAGVWATGSMGGLGMTVVGALLVLALHGGARLPARQARAAVAVAALVAAAGVAALAYRGHGGLDSRTIVYDYALQVIEARPWLGLGGGNWPLAVGSAPLGVSRYWFRSHPHSLPLMIVAEVGLIGLAFAVAFFAVPLWIAARRLPAASPTWRAVAVGAIAGLLALLGHGLVNYFLRHPVNGIATGLLLGIALGAARRPVLA